MSIFGTTDNVKGSVQIAEHQLITSKATKEESYTGKNIKRCSFEWNDRSPQAFKEILATGVSLNGRESYYNGWGFSRSVMSNRGGVGNWNNVGFMEKCDASKGVKHIIANMKRLKVRQYIKTDVGVFEEDRIVEYLTFVMKYIGKDWKGSRIVSPDIIEGVYEQPTLRTEILNFDPNTGEPRVVTMWDKDILVYGILYSLGRQKDIR
jgi:hypothetical protein